MKKAKSNYWKILDDKGHRERYQNEKQYIHDHRNEIGRCPYCNSNIKDRFATLHKGLIDALYQVYCWCGKNRKHEFHTKEVKHLFGHTEYARFGDFVRFGGIIYKPKVNGKSQKALYGINMLRAKEFFAGTREIPVQITLDQITGEIVGEVKCNVKDFPSITALLTKDGLYDHEKPVQEIMNFKDESHS